MLIFYFSPIAINCDTNLCMAENKTVNIENCHDVDVKSTKNISDDFIFATSVWTNDLQN